MRQFGTRTLFSTVAVFACLSSMPVAWRGCYYYERNVIIRLLSKYPEIENVSLGGFPDGITENIVVTSFSIRGRPNTIIKVCGLEDTRDGSFSHLNLQRIGSLTFVVAGYGHIGVRDTASGEPVKTHFWRTAVDIGPDTEFAGVLPYTVSTLDELIARYDDLNAYFQTWPTKDNYGTIKHPDGMGRHYYVQDTD